MNKVVRSKIYSLPDFKELNSKVNSFLKKIAKEDLVAVNFDVEGNLYNVQIVYMQEVAPKA